MAEIVGFQIAPAGVGHGIQAILDDGSALIATPEDLMNAFQKNNLQQVVAVHLTEALVSGTKVKTLSVPLPANSLLTNLLGELVAYSTAATSCTLRVGDDDDDEGYLSDQDMTDAGSIVLSAAGGPIVGEFGNGSELFGQDGGNYSGTNGVHYPNGGHVLFSLTTVDDGTHATLDGWVYVLYTVGFPVEVLS